MIVYQLPVPIVGEPVESVLAAFPHWAERITRAFDAIDLAKARLAYMPGPRSISSDDGWDYIDGNLVARGTVRKEWRHLPALTIGRNA